MKPNYMQKEAQMRKQRMSLKNSKLQAELAIYTNKKLAAAIPFGSDEELDVLASELYDLLTANTRLDKKCPVFGETERFVDRKIISAADKQKIKELGI